MTTLYTFDIQGQTTSSVAIGTLTDVTIDSEGFFNFTDSESRKQRIKIEGAFGKLVKELYTGASGLDAGSAGVQGHRVFGIPVLTQ
jgi:hypothetical protein